MPTVRAEQPSDFEAVRNVNERAFRRTDEAALVDVLRDDTLLIASLVAIEGRVVGHAMFSRVWIDDASGVVPMASLAPMAVLPECQRKGIGAALIARGRGGGNGHTSLLQLCGDHLTLL